MRSNSQIYSRYFTYIKPFTKLPIVRTYGFTIFTLFVTAFFIIFAIRPTLSTILVLQKKMDDSNQVLKKVDEKVNNLSLAKQNLDKLESNTNIKSKIDAAIPDGSQLKSIIQTLEGLAKNHEASVSALQFQPLILEESDQNRLGGLSEISFTFNSEGQYQNLLLLLQDLKRSTRLISLDSLSLSKLTEVGGLIMSISGKAYYLK